MAHGRRALTIHADAPSLIRLSLPLSIICFLTSLHSTIFLHICHVWGLVLQGMRSR